MKYPMLLVGSVLLSLVAGCHRQTSKEADLNGAVKEERVFEAKGVVREIAPDRRKAVIRHEEIPGYMPRMTMELIVRDPRELEKIASGDLITFRLHATADTHWIDVLRRIGRGATEPAVFQGLFIPQDVPEMGPGDLLPDQEFLSETGQPMRLTDFRGRALALTFFFTRCPLPDYCPRMNKNFGQAREILLKNTQAPTNWQFLCVSFDAEFDRPAILKGYARVFRGENPDRWLFAAATSEVLASIAPRLDLKVGRDGGSFSHNLRTVVLDAQGRIRHQFDGNEWTPEQLAVAVIEAANASSLPQTEPTDGN